MTLREKNGPALRRDDCSHRQVTAYTIYRSVRCSLCGEELDPFDVLVDMLKVHMPKDSEEEGMVREMVRRSGKMDEDTRFPK